MVAGIANRGAASARSGVMEHAIRTDEGLLLRIPAEETVVDHQRHRLGDEVVENLDGDLNGDLNGLVRLLAKHERTRSVRDSPTGVARSAPSVQATCPNT